MAERPQKCRSCGAPILWAETITGRRMPLDYEPSDKGNIILGLRRERPPLALVQVEITRARLLSAGELLYTSHFASCPQASTHRRKHQ
jgi:hypothetical protein